MATIFISYRREDSGGYAGRLHEELEERLDARVFRDLDTLEPGQDFVAAIETRLRECRVFIALLGPAWLTSRSPSGERRLDGAGDFVRMEIAAALTRPEVLVLPVLVGGAAMPSDTQLPNDIRALCRRQAVTLRDETWEEDVDRLGTAIGRHLGVGNVLRRRNARRPGMALIAGIVLAAALLSLVAMWMGPFRSSTPDATHAEASAAAERDDGVGAGAHAIEIPRMSEIAHGDVIYTLLSGSLRPRGARSTLWLRFRVSNEGSFDANLWDQSFRISTGGDVVPASGGLNELLSGHSIQQQVVRFEIPSGSTQARLQITSNGRIAELPLDLTSTGRPPGHDEPDTGDALSRADMRALVRDPVALIATGDLRATVTRVTVRRFVNETRLFVTLRVENRGPYARFSGDLIVRLAALGELAAPARITSDAVEARSTLPVEVVFDVPPAVTAATLRGAVGSATGEVPLTFR